jgi:hypothetical protein
VSAPLVVALIIVALGTLLYCLDTGKLQEVGRAALWAGMFAVAALLCGLLP